MKLSSKAENILNEIDDKTKLGDLRKIANDIRKDHDLAMELWVTGKYLARQLAILIMDKKLLSQELIDKLDKDIRRHQESKRNQLIDWLMANQLSKDKKTIALMESWENSSSSLQRRTYWYYQGRLRWLGQTPPPNNEELLSKIENQIEKEEPEVQWAIILQRAGLEFMTKSIGIAVSQLEKKQAFTKVRWFQRDVLQHICQNSLRLKVTSENYNFTPLLVFEFNKIAG